MAISTVSYPRRIGDTRRLDEQWLKAEQAQHPYPDFTADPTAWTYRLRARMHAYAKRSVPNDLRRTTLVNLVCDKCEAHGVMGSEERCWVQFKWDLRTYLRATRRDHAQNERRLAETRRLQTLGFDLKCEKAKVDLVIRKHITQQNDPTYVEAEEEIRAMATQTAMKNAEERQRAAAAAEAKDAAKPIVTDYDTFDKVKCTHCDGEGTDPVDVGKTCPECFGDGWVYNKKSAPADWTKDQKKVGQFFGKYNEMCERYEDAPKGGKADVFLHEHLKAVYQIDSLKKYPGKAADLILELSAALSKAFKLKAEFQPETEEKSTTPENGAGEAEAKTEPTGQSAPPTPAAPDSSRSEPTIDLVTGEILPDEPLPELPAPSKELIVFDASRAIGRAEAAKAVVDRMVSGGVLVKDVDYGEIPGAESKDPNKKKYNLLKPGAEKLLTAFHLFDQFKPTEIVRDWKTGFFFYEYECTLYDRETGKAIGSGIGSCNSMEKKYRYRWVTRDRVPKNLSVADLPVKGSKLSEPEFAIEKAETTGQYGKPAEYWQQFRDALANGTAVPGTRTTKNGKEMRTWEIDATVYGIPNEDIFDQVNTISKMAQKRALVAAALNATGASAVFTQDLEDFSDFGLFEKAG